MCQGDNNMKFTVSQLRRIIKEEVSRLLESSEAPKQDKSPKKTKDSKHSKIKKLVDELKELLETENLDENLYDDYEYAQQQEKAAKQWQDLQAKKGSPEETAKQQASVRKHQAAAEQGDRYDPGDDVQRLHRLQWYGY